MKEIWKDIKDYEGYYQVSNLGNVRSLDREVTYKDGRVYKYKGKIKSQRKLSGYYMVSLYKGDTSNLSTVHEIVTGKHYLNY